MNRSTVQASSPQRILYYVKELVPTRLSLSRADRRFPSTPYTTTSVMPRQPPMTAATSAVDTCAPFERKVSAGSGAKWQTARIC